MLGGLANWQRRPGAEKIFEHLKHDLLMRRTEIDGFVMILLGGQGGSRQRGDSRVPRGPWQNLRK